MCRKHDWLCLFILHTCIVDRFARIMFYLQRLDVYIWQLGRFTQLTKYVLDGNLDHQPGNLNSHSWWSEAWKQAVRVWKLDLTWTYNKANQFTVIAEMCWHETLRYQKSKDIIFKLDTKFNMNFPSNFPLEGPAKLRPTLSLRRIEIPAVCCKRQKG